MLSVELCSSGIDRIILYQESIQERAKDWWPLLASVVLLGLCSSLPLCLLWAFAEKKKKGKRKTKDRVWPWRNACIGKNRSKFVCWRSSSCNQERAWKDFKGRQREGDSDDRRIIWERGLNGWIGVFSWKWGQRRSRKCQFKWFPEK